MQQRRSGAITPITLATRDIRGNRTARWRKPKNCPGTTQGPLVSSLFIALNLFGFSVGVRFHKISRLQTFDNW
jgi:hypothetical protein